MCLSVRHCMPTLLHGPGCNLGNGNGCPLVVHCWADLQSAHRFCCYDNRANAKCQRVLVTVLFIWLTWAIGNQHMHAWVRYKHTCVSYIHSFLEGLIFSSKLIVWIVFQHFSFRTGHILPRTALFLEMHVLCLTRRDPSKSYRTLQSKHIAVLVWS